MFTIVVALLREAIQKEFKDGEVFTKKAAPRSAAVASELPATRGGTGSKSENGEAWNRPN